MPCPQDLGTDDEAPLVYDAAVVFAALFSDRVLARQLATQLTCGEINVLLGVLHAGGRDDATPHWVAAHRPTCTQPDCH